YQIWIMPDRPGWKPSYSQKAFAEGERRGQLRVVASTDGRDGSLQIHQDAQVFLSTLDREATVTHQLKPGRHAWLQVLRGAVALNGISLAAGDGAAVSEESALAIRATEPAEVMLFDLA